MKRNKESFSGLDVLLSRFNQNREAGLSTAADRNHESLMRQPQNLKQNFFF